MKKSKLLLILLFISAIILARLLGLDQYFTLDNLKSLRDNLSLSYGKNPFLFYIIYIAVYIISVAVNIPGASILTLAGGAIFGLWQGLILVSLSSTLGATLSFIISRYLLRDTLRSKFSDIFKKIDSGMSKDGGFYLLSLRLVPLFPFFLINMLTGFTSISLPVYIFVSWLGMLPGTFVYVNAGTQLAAIKSVSDILTPQLLGAFVLLGIFPFIAKAILNILKKNRIYKNYKRPKKFDFNFIVIGAGAAGLVSSIVGSTVKAKVALIEKDKMGGDCLNTGCVPSKTILSIAKKVKTIEKFPFNKKPIEVSIDFDSVKNKIKEVVDKIAPNDSVERYSSMGVECIKGEARLTSPYSVSINNKIITASNIILASGAEPFVPKIPGIDKIQYYTSENIWNIEKLPEKMVVLGGGPIGCELAQAFSRLGTSVTIIEMADRIFLKEDTDVSSYIKELLIKDGLEIITSYKATEFCVDVNEKYSVKIVNSVGDEKSISFDCALLALGRKARTTGFGLEELNIAKNPDGTITTDQFMRTNIPNIFACGDLAGPYQFTHTASHTAWYAAVNALFGGFKKFKKDFSVIPWVTYTDPEVARVGLSEDEAKLKGIKYELTRYNISELDRAVTENIDYGFIKILTVPKKDKILGVVIIAPNAGELLMEFVVSMKFGIGLNKLLGVIHPYPTWAEADKFAAGVWKKKRKPEKILNILEIYFKWKRG